ncbi:MAG: glycosyltransferase [Gemmatimonadales bacterium]
MHAPDGLDSTVSERRRAFTDARRAHWDNVATASRSGYSAGLAYSRELQRVIGNVVLPGQRVLELGCGQGDLLAALQPSVGVGVDLSPEMTARATARHPGLRFIAADALDADIEGTFDVIVLSDLLNEIWDAQGLFRRIAGWCSADTRIVISIHSQLWKAPLDLARRAGLATPLLQQNWFAPEDVSNLLALEGLELVRRNREILFPLPIPLIQPLANRFAAKLPVVGAFCLVNLFVARRARALGEADAPPAVSVVVPARNEAGNIADILRRIPDMGAGTEIVFVEGGSVDDTWAVIAREVEAQPRRRCKVVKQQGRGKGDAVRAGFREATGDIFMILDADISVAPEDLARFYGALVSGRGEMINGVRLVYPMDGRAMQFLNLVANKTFGMIFSWLLGQPVRETLCGTKVLWRRHYERIAANRAHFGEFDPFGDFDLLFGAARLSLRIVDLPVRYQERVYGSTNIQRWRHGVLLLRMVFLAARRLKFV